MGERKGQNKYYPPDFDPKKHFNLAGYHGQHPLRERARKLHQGILIIRFEMPYNIWCDGCGNHIGMGVRYNAEKSKIGKYYTTPIYKFRMKCHLCNNHFEIKTDPANHDYVIISGARRKEQRWDPTENGQIVPEDRSSQKKLATDAMFKLEHGFEDQKKVKAALPTIHALEEVKATMKDDYVLNKLARKQFRDEKKMLKTATEADEALLAKSSLAIALVPESRDDVRLAGLLKYKSRETFEEKEKQRRSDLEQSSIFGGSLTSGSPAQRDVKVTKVDVARDHLVKIVQQQRPNPFAVNGHGTSTGGNQSSFETSSNSGLQSQNLVKKSMQRLPENLTTVSLSETNKSSDTQHLQSSNVPLTSIVANYDSSSDESNT